MTLEDIYKRLDSIEKILEIRLKTKQPEILVNVPTFVKITGIGDTKAREIFRNKELIRRGILVKTNKYGDRGGWMLRYERWLKWASDMAMMEMGVV